MESQVLKIALAGIGKIARDQHLPTLEKSDEFDLVAAVSRHGTVDGVANFTSLEEALQAMPEIDAVSLATPPKVRYAQALASLKAGKHVMLEKPPGANVNEVNKLSDYARRQGLALYASWHSRAAPAVAPARKWLEKRELKSVKFYWLEDIRHWHPGQDWILEAEGFGVFDAGINGLSVVTAILPVPFSLQSANLHIPANRQAPIAAEMNFVTFEDAPVYAELDFLHEGPPRWDVIIETSDGTVEIFEGGAAMKINGSEIKLPEPDEYYALYRRFAELIAADEQDVDLAPMIHTADALRIGERETAAPFEW